MSNIKNLQMWKTICTDERVNITKSMLGLKTTASYQKTGSIIDVRILEFSPADGERVKQILSAPKGEIAKAIGTFRPQPVVNGNYMLEVCQSRDNAFLAVQLLQFVQMNYETVTSVLIFEGDEAKAVGRLL